MFSCSSVLRFLCHPRVRLPHRCCSGTPNRVRRLRNCCNIRFSKLRQLASLGKITTLTVRLTVLPRRATSPATTAPCQRNRYATPLPQDRHTHTHTCPSPQVKPRTQGGAGVAPLEPLPKKEFLQESTDTTSPASSSSSDSFTSFSPPSSRQPQLVGQPTRKLPVSASLPQEHPQQFAQPQHSPVSHQAQRQPGRLRPLLPQDAPVPSAHAPSTNFGAGGHSKPAPLGTGRYASQSPRKAEPTFADSPVTASVAPVASRGSLGGSVKGSARYVPNMPIKQGRRGQHPAPLLHGTGLNTGTRGAHVAPSAGPSGLPSGIGVSTGLRKPMWMGGGDAQPQPQPQPSSSRRSPAATGLPTPRVYSRADASQASAPKPKKSGFDWDFLK